MKLNMNTKTVSCRSIKQDLSLLAGRDLTDRDRIETVRRHIAVCPQCREKYRGLRDGLKALTTDNSNTDAIVGSDGGTWVESDRSLWPDLASRLPARPSSMAGDSSRFSLSRNWPPLVAMVAACGVMAVVLFAPGGPGNHPHGEAVTEAATFEAEAVPASTPANDKAVPAKTPSVFQFKVPSP